MLLFHRQIWSLESQSSFPRTQTSCSLVTSPLSSSSFCVSCHLLSSLQTSRSLWFRPRGLRWHMTRRERETEQLCSLQLCYLHPTLGHSDTSAPFCVKLQRGFTFVCSLKICRMSIWVFYFPWSCAHFKEIFSYFSVIFTQVEIIVCGNWQHARQYTSSFLVIFSLFSCLWSVRIEWMRAAWPLLLLLTCFSVNLANSLWTPRNI